MGKNFSANNMGQRKKSDFYETPYSITGQFLQRESPSGVIHDPACGNGAICKVLNNSGFNATGSDISSGVDFLLDRTRRDSILTNPPFSIAYEFIVHAKTVTDYFAFLLPLSYLHGKARHDNIYMDKTFPLSRIYVFTRYPMLGDDLRDDGKYRTGMMVYAWFVWDKNNTSPEPTIRWIDNQPYILSKSDEPSK
jgi:hypothetical protein